MDHYSFDRDSFLERGTLFPAELELSPWVIYHGTSGTAEDSIEVEGLAPISPIVSADDVRALVATFEALNWAGESGGYLCLATFSKSDYVLRAEPAVALAHTPTQAAMYATRDWAGGEVARAIRMSLEELDLFLSDPKTRARHHERQLKESREDCGARVIDPESVLDMLRDRLRSVIDLRSRCDAYRARHRHGLVYAVSVQEGDLSRLCNEDHTVRWTGHIPPERLLAKVQLPAALSEPDINRARVGSDDRMLTRLEQEPWHSRVRRCPW